MMTRPRDREVCHGGGARPRMTRKAPRALGDAQWRRQGFADLKATPHPRAFALSICPLLAPVAVILVPRQSWQWSS